MFVTSRWFPLGFALSVTTLHIALIGSDYLAATRNDKRFDARQFIRRDLNRPLFEEYGFCDAWTYYTAGQSAALGLDLPAYLAATLLHSSVNWQVTCVDALITPRGQIVTAAFVPPLWFAVGLSVRRLAQRRWRHRTTGWLPRALICLGLALFPIGVVTLIFGVLGLLFRDLSLSVRLAGFAFWLFYFSILCAERLRVWPYKLV